MMTINSDESLVPSQVSLEQLLVETRQYLRPQDIERIQRAYDLANRAHRGVVRRSGEPYIQHPLEVALLLAHMRIDADGIVSALLHDVVEDTSYTLDDIREQFGDAVAQIVDGVTKFEALAEDNHDASSGGDANHQRAETVRKMLLAMAEDPRVVVLKLADRLHNMRTLDAMKPAQQQNKARETREIYAPLARRLGMALVQAELEDLALKYLEPERYTLLAREVEKELCLRQPYIGKVRQAIQDEMDQAGISAQVYDWRKHLSSINHKIQNIDELGQLHDLVSFRILVNSEYDCYLALGHIHALWRPKDGRIKDFIATPKLNGYQSLHTTVFCLDNRLTEIQIRTHDMQRIADYGIASYWYMRERGKLRLSREEMIAWIEQLRSWQRELPQNADEFVEAVKGDIFQEQIFVFTPKGEVKDLPRGSTPLDMAYRIHTDIGDHCAGARIITNTADTERLVTRLVPLDYELKSGEIVEIMTKRTVHPTYDWLSFARTTTARTKIRRYLKTYEREINLQLGRERLDLALKALGATGVNVVLDEELTGLNNCKKYSTAEDVYVALGREELSVSDLLEGLLPVLVGRGDIKEEIGKDEHSSSGNGQSESSHLMVKLADCCYPIPGDAIVGMLEPNEGMCVHLNKCRNIQQHKGLLVEINWNQIGLQQYLMPMVIVAHDRAGLLRDVAAVVSDAGVNMTTVASTTNPSLQKAVITVTLEIKAVDQIESIFKRIQQVKNVVSVTRDFARQVG